MLLHYLWAVINAFHRKRNNWKSKWRKNLILLRKREKKNVSRFRLQLDTLLKRLRHIIEKIIASLAPSPSYVCTITAPCSMQHQIVNLQTVLLKFFILINVIKSCSSKCHAWWTLVANNCKIKMWMVHWTWWTRIRIKQLQTDRLQSRKYGTTNLD